MKKFFILLKKEIKELLTLQMIAPFLIVVVVFYFLGSFMGQEAKKQASLPPKLALMDLDNSPLSKSIVELLKNNQFDIQEYPISSENDYLKQIKNDKIKAAVIIPQNFSQGIKDYRRQKIPTYTLVNNLSITATKNTAVLDSAIQIINDSISNNLIMANGQSLDPQFLKNPVLKFDHVVIKDKTAQINTSAIMGFVSQQTMVIPIILFLVIVLASQMIATAVATEKENKTLETLLSIPINRKIIVSAKMVAAGLIALLMAAIYMFGMQSYMNGITGGALDAASKMDGARQIALELGLTFSLGGYIILGTMLFISILLALAVAMILGAFAEDAKGAQGVVAPLMVLILIPYFLSMFMDINSLSPTVKYLIYAIPFTHTFLAAPNILLGNLTFVIYGIIYQFIFFVFFVWLAAKIFSSDYIMTMKLSFGKKKDHLEEKKVS